MAGATASATSLQPWETTTLQSIGALLVATNLVLLARALRIATRDRARIITRSGLLPFDDKPLPAAVAAGFLHSVAADDQGRLAGRRPRPFSSSGPLPLPLPPADVCAPGVVTVGVLPPPPPPTPPAQLRYQSRRPAPLEVEAARGLCGTITQRVLVARGALMAIIAAAAALDAVVWIVHSASTRSDVPVAVMHRVAHVAMITAGNLVTAKRMRMLVDPAVRAKWGVPWTWVVGVTTVVAVLWVAAGVLRVAQAAMITDRAAFWTESALPQWTDIVALALPILGPVVIVAVSLARTYALWKHRRARLQPVFDNYGGIGSASPPTGPSTLLLYRLAHAVSVSLTASSISTATFASRLTLSARSALSLGGGRLDSTGRAPALPATVPMTAPPVHVQATSTESNLKPVSATGSSTVSGAAGVAIPRGAPTLALPEAELPRAASSPGTLATAAAPRNRADCPPRDPAALESGPTSPPQGLAPEAGMTRSSSRGMTRSNSRSMVRSNSNSRGMVRSGSSTSTSSHQSRRSRASTAGTAASAASGRSDQSVSRMHGATGDRITPSSPSPPAAAPPSASTTRLVVAVHFAQALLWAVVLAVNLGVQIPIVAGVVADAAVTLYIALDMRFYGAIRKR
ncbi:hypothetical protein GGF32_008313 [Allomyces javanicus]|nr:hypothetical protein GGF32_008313 [Allomyces javanicus]